MLCPIKFNSNTIELKVHTSCYCVLDLPLHSILSFRRIALLLDVMSGRGRELEET